MKSNQATYYYQLKLIVIHKYRTKCARKPKMGLTFSLKLALSYYWGENKLFSSPWGPQNRTPQRKILQVGNKQYWIFLANELVRTIAERNFCPFTLEENRSKNLASRTHTYIFMLYFFKNSQNLFRGPGSVLI